jgi:hypothetical protein
MTLTGQNRLAVLAIATIVILQCPVAAQNQTTTGNSFQQWGFLILENTDYDEAVANPTFQKIHNRNNNRLLSQYFAISHPSLPNYLATIAGTTFGEDEDAPPSKFSFPDLTILDLLDEKAISWKFYAEDYPGGCLEGVTASDSNDFVGRHVPALYSERITGNSTRCDQIVDASQFQVDLDQGTLPQWWYYVPNMRNDGHDTSLDYASSYLEREWMNRFENETFTRDLAMVVGFDESESKKAPNRVYAALVGDAISGMPGGHEDPARHNHYSLIRTVEENWDLGSLGKEDATAAVIRTNNQTVTRTDNSSQPLPASAATTHRLSLRSMTSGDNSSSALWYAVVCLMLMGGLAR